MKSIRIQIGKKNIRFALPESWIDVNLSALKQIAPFIIQQTILPDEIHIKLLYAASGLKKKQFFKLFPKTDQQTELENTNALQSLLEEIKFMQELSFTKDIVGSIGVWPFKMRDVGNNLHRISFDQWLFAAAKAQAYFTAKTIKDKQAALNQLFAALCSPWFMPWREWLLPFNHLIARLLSTNLKLAILVNYLGLKAGLLTRFTHLFSEDNKKNPNFNELITDLAGNKFGQVEEVGKQGAVFILTYLNKSIREQEKK